MVDVTTQTPIPPKGPSTPLSSTSGVRTRRSPQKANVPIPRSTRSSASANGGNGVVQAGSAPVSASASASGSSSAGVKVYPKRTPTPSRSQSQHTSPQRPKSEQRRRKPLFVSCVTYPETAPLLAPVVAVTKDGNQPPQRSQRKSKVEAMNKIDRAGTPSTVAAEPAATSFVPPPPLPAAPAVALNPLKRPRVINPPFDLNTVRTKAPVLDAQAASGSQSRAFDLPTCPTYHPTAEQFRDPMAYIESISPEAKAYGICKIVPPEGWHMPFDMDTDSFRFMTRLQRLNSIEAASRAKINFLEQLSMFHKQQGDAGAHVPIIDHRLLDVWRLRKEVNKLGGIDEVNRLKAWPTITGTLGFAPTATGQIRSAYTRLILPFETWALRAKSYPESPLTPMVGSAVGSANGKLPPGMGPNASPGTPMGSKQSRMGMRSSPRGAPNLAAGTPGGSALAAVMANDNQAGPSHAPPSSDSGLAAPIRIKVPGFQTSSHGSDSELSEEESSRTASQTSTPAAPQAKYEKGDVCEICTVGTNAAKILLCDGCDRGFHTFCLDPPLSGIPQNEWYCTACLLGNGDDFGFDEGEMHSLASFQARDEAFTKAWFNRYAQMPLTPNAPGPLTRTLGNTVVSEADVEREFWRLVESQDDTVEVEYGADVHSSTHGSAAPTTETRPTSKYARDPWNLNNMAIVRDSILRYIKSDISGMTVPWIYVGMLFSAFCWHNEDHYTYSVNYMFWGETKTWYGIPGDGAEKFEDAMRREAPELFERQPSLLYQLVTIMNPNRLKEEGVPVYACDQRPNEFVITFPKAYHCGFNHGLNFNEAVNFALPDWLPQGKTSVERYREHAKPPVFSHEELLITITLYSDTIKTALWLEGSLRLMVDEETARRQRLREKVPDLVETLSEEDVPEEQYQCCVCKCFCYLAQVTCTCTKLVTCLDHHEMLCACAPSNRTLRKRYSDEQLQDILDIVATRASQPAQWQERFDAAMDVPRPQLKSIRQLVADGERIPYDLPGLNDLREFLARANSWVERATAVCTRKSTGRRRKGRASEAVLVVEDDDVDRSPAALRALIDEAESLAFDTPEILQLRQMVDTMEDFRRDAQAVLSLPSDKLNYEECKTTLILGQSLNVELPEVAALAKIVARLQWHYKVEEEIDDRALHYEDIVQLLDEAKENGIADNHASVVELRRREEKGRTWKEAVDKLFATDSIPIDKLSELIDAPEFTPVSLVTMGQLENIRKTAQGWQQQAQAHFANRSTTQGAGRVCRAAASATGPLRKVLIPEVAELQAELDFIDEWTEGIAQLLDVDASSPRKLTGSIETLKSDLSDHLATDDIEPNDKHVCFCRHAPVENMVTCVVCSGDYHPKCVGLAGKGKAAASIKAAAENWKCQMCLNLQYDDRPTLSSLIQYADPIKWNFRLRVPAFDVLQQCIMLPAQYAAHVVKLYDSESDAIPERKPISLQIVSHLLRKIWTLPIQLCGIRTVFDPMTCVTSIDELLFEPWLYARLRGFVDKEGPKTSGGRVRARKPRFTFNSAHPHTFACLCTTEPLDHLLTVACSKCEQGFHMSCVGAPINATAPEAKWRCPFCTIKSGKAPARLDLRTQMPDKIGTNEFVDWRQTIYTYAKDPIICHLPMVADIGRPIVILEISKFTPPAVPDGFEPPVWTELDELGIDKRKRRRTGDVASSIPSTPRALDTPGTSKSVLASPAVSSTPSRKPPSPQLAPALPLPPNEPAQNSRSNGSLYYPTHKNVPWENTNMFSQFQLAKPAANGSATPAPAPVPVTPKPPGTVVPPSVPSTHIVGTVVPPRTTVHKASVASPAPPHLPVTAEQIPNPVSTPQATVASDVVHTASAPVQHPTPAPAITVPVKRALPLDMDASLPPVKRHSPAPPAPAPITSVAHAPQVPPSAAASQPPPAPSPAPSPAPAPAPQASPATN